jgi:hypothetical protein
VHKYFLLLILHYTHTHTHKHTHSQTLERIEDHGTDGKAWNEHVKRMTAYRLSVLNKNADVYKVSECVCGYVGVCECVQGE